MLTTCKISGLFPLHSLKLLFKIRSERMKSYKTLLFFSFLVVPKDKVCENNE